MKKFIKKVVGSCLLAFMLVSVMGNAVTMANNSSDTTFTYKFYGDNLCTVGREKRDTSKMYMKCTSIASNMSYTAHAVGRRTPTSSQLTANGVRIMQICIKMQREEDGSQPSSF